jgi:serine/threonine-protein kinase
MLLETGQVVDGKYRITRLIGTGGMGAVYEGENILIRRRVAIKVLHADSSTNTDVIRRFEREAQAAGEIGNDHILEVLDLGSLENGDRFMVMEYLDGETLSARIERLGRLTPQQIAPIAQQFLTALVSAHAAGIIHRDLKPENIFILRSKAGRADFVKLIDFGISKFSRPFKEGEHRMTRANAVLGTPCYMSPEQARGAAETDVRSDIYSCGVILFESVTGRLPFEGDSFNDLMFKIALSDAPSPTAYLPSLDPGFAWIISHALERDPSVRFASAQEFVNAIEAWMSENALAGGGSGLDTSGAFYAREKGHFEASTLASNEVDAIGLRKRGSQDSWARSKAETPTSQPRRRRALLAASSLAGLAAVCLGIAFLVRADPVPAILRGAAASSAAALPPTTAATATLAAPPGQAETAPGFAAEPHPPPSASLAEPYASAGAPHHRWNAAPPTKPTKSVESAHPTAPVASEKPKPPPTSNGFDLGY